MAIRVPTQSALKPISALKNSLPYRLDMKFDHNRPDFRDIYLFKNVNKQGQQTINTSLEPMAQVS